MNTVHLAELTRIIERFGEVTEDVVRLEAEHGPDGRFTGPGGGGQKEHADRLSEIAHKSTERAPNTTDTTKGQHAEAGKDHRKAEEAHAAIGDFKKAAEHANQAKIHESFAAAPYHQSGGMQGKGMDGIHAAAKAARRDVAGVSEKKFKLSVTPDEPSLDDMLVAMNAIC